jgi:hypothetical protein
MGCSLAVAACVQVRASSKRDALSFSVVDFNAERRASSAYRRNSLASDMTVLPAHAVPLADLGGVTLTLSPAEFGELIADETENWGKVIRAANIKPQ